MIVLFVAYTDEKTFMVILRMKLSITKSVNYDQAHKVFKL